MLVRPILLSGSQGERFSIIGGGVRLLADGAATDGRCCMFEAPIPAGEGPPLHRHDREDEYFFVLSGRFKFAINGDTFIGEPGAFVAAPRGSIHAFRNIGPETGTMLITCTPAGIEEAFRAIRVPEPGSNVAPPTIEMVVSILGAHGVTFLGPPLD